MSNNNRPIQISPYTQAGTSVVQAGTSVVQALSSNVVKPPNYRVRMTANNKSFYMLLPPNADTKHPGKANPMQMPGLQIKSATTISKLRIPGFFPIYQHLGIDSITVTMSGMFTGYDGLREVSSAGNWEEWRNGEISSQDIYGQLNIPGVQDSYAAASEFFEFAVTQKVPVQVTIFTEAKNPSTSKSYLFRDNQSNIAFKGYVKEFEALYVRQDRNYYLMKFEVLQTINLACVDSKTESTTSIKPKEEPKSTDLNSCIDNEDLNKLVVLFNNTRGQDQITRVITDSDIPLYSLYKISKEASFREKVSTNVANVDSTVSAAIDFYVKVLVGFYRKDSSAAVISIKGQSEKVKAECKKDWSQFWLARISGKGLTAIESYLKSINK